MTKCDLARGLMVFASWWLVQVPAKDVRLDEPGSNLPPIIQFKKVKQFDSAGECEAYRDVALQDVRAKVDDLTEQSVRDPAASIRLVR